MGKQFHTKGFGINCGLPDYSETLPNFSSGGVYTHYPPGPDWVMGAMMSVCGTNSMSCVRAGPMGLGLFALGLFAYSLPFLLPILGSFLLATIVVVLPMTWVHIHGLAYWGYPHALLLLQMALIVLSMGRGRVRAPVWIGYALCGFAQGWFSFDYAFVACLLPIPFALLDYGRLPRNGWLGLVLCGGGFFTLAHILHFAQNICHFGSLEAAILDFKNISDKRSTGLNDTIEWIKVENLTPLNVLRAQLDTYIVRPENFGFAAQIIIYLVALLALFKAKWSVAMRHKVWRVEFSRAGGYAVLVALVLASLWSITIRQHAYFHTMTCRHFIVPFVLALIVVIRAQRLETRR